MTHDEVVDAIQARAAARGVLTHYCPRSERCTGDNGMPDLLLVGTAGLAWVEVKTPGDRMKPDQTRWKYALRAIGEIHEVMGEDDLGEGRAVDELLTFVGGRLAPDPRPDARPGRAGRTRLSTPMPLGYPS